MASSTSVFRPGTGRRVRLWLLLWGAGVLSWGVVLGSLPNPRGRWRLTHGTASGETPALAADLLVGQPLPALERPAAQVGLRFGLSGAKTDSEVELLLLEGGEAPAGERELKRRVVARTRVGHKRLRRDRFWRWDLSGEGGPAAGVLAAGAPHYLVVGLGRVDGTPRIRLRTTASEAAGGEAASVQPWPGGEVQLLATGSGGGLSARGQRGHLVLELGSPGRQERLLASLAGSGWGLAALAALLLGGLGLVVWLVPAPDALLRQVLASRRARLLAAPWSGPERRIWLPAVAVALLLLAVRLLQTAWISDDAYLTFRTVAGFVSGHGLGWNPGERVQIYTHPLWMLLLSAGYLLTGSCNAAALGLGLALSGLAAWLLVRRVAATAPGAVLAVLLLICSAAFTDFSTGGLENPLVHLLLVLFGAALLRDDGSPAAFMGLWLLAALVLLTRMDAVLLVLPGLALASVRHLRSGSSPGTSLRLAALALLPFVCWELFSVLYYGAPFPNTAYAKLNTGISRLALLRQGQLYLLNSLAWDPATLVIVAGAAVVPLTVRQEQGRLYALLAGAWLQVLYVAGIGGCFMSGRMLAGPLVASVLVWARLPLERGRLWPGLMPLVALLAASTGTLFGQREALRGDAQQRWFSGGITSERLFYFRSSGLMTMDRQRDLFDNPEPPADHLTSHLVCGGAGLRGFRSGQRTLVVDPCALGDAFLARLPAMGAYDLPWRIGHFERVIPRGYAASLSTGQNLLLSPQLSVLYDQVRAVTTWDMLDPERAAAIWRLNTGGLSPLLAGFRTVEVSLARVAAPPAEGTPWDRPGNTPVREGGVLVDLPERRFDRRLEVSLDHDGRYRLLFVRNYRPLCHLDLGPTPRGRGLVTYRADVPEEAVSKGYDYIRVLAVAGKSRFALGHLVLR